MNVCFYARHCLLSLTAFLFLAAVFAPGFAHAAKPQAAPADSPQPSISVRPKNLHLGKIKRGVRVLYRFIIENRGEGDLYIRNFKNKGGLNNTSLDKKAIKKGKKIEITGYSIPGTKGKFEEFLVIKSKGLK